MKKKEIDDLVLEKELGNGSFGVVYLTSLKNDSTKKLATKRLERAEIEGTKLMDYFKNEIEILQRLDHPNIVKFHSLKKTKKFFYLAMEFCNGGGLDEALEKYQEKYGKPFSEEIVQYLMRQIIDAFKYIHSKRIIHRDVKLENILINFENEKDKEEFDMMKATVKIVDFGFSCYINKSGSLYSTVGSPINMDPIILKKKNDDSTKARQLGYDQKADIWSLGTICYEMLIGKSAFDANDMEELVEKIENGTYTVPTSLSSEVVSFINGMLQYDSQKRLSSDELIKHPFLTKEVKDFHPIDLKKVSKKVGEEGLEINTKKNKSIWAIFNATDEKKLLGINRKNALKEQELDTNFEDLILPEEGIPGNPIEKENQEDPPHGHTYFNIQLRTRLQYIDVGIL